MGKKRDFLTDGGNAVILVDETIELGGRTLPYPKTCILCSGPATRAAFFTPGDPEAFGQPEGKERIFMYGLCGDCKPAVANCGAVERAIVCMLGLN